MAENVGDKSSSVLRSYLVINNKKINKKKEGKKTKNYCRNKIRY